MSVLQAIVLGLVQGLTEFLPISSSGHLLIVPAMAGWDDPGAAFTAVIQLGTMAAVLMFFRSDLLRITSRLAARSCGFRSRERSTEANLGWFIILGTIPISIFGFIFRDQIESGARSLYLVGIDADRVLVRDARRRAIRLPRAAAQGDQRPRRSVHRHLAGLRADPRRLALGRDDLRRPVPQLRPDRRRPLLVPALGPGGRRSAACSSSRTSAARAASGSSPTAVATIVAFISGYAAIAWLLRYLAHHSLAVFVAYRIPLGILVIALAASGAIS